MQRARNPNSYRSKAMDLLVDTGRKVIARELGRELGIDGRRASMILHCMYREKMILREPILHSGESESRWRYFAEKQDHKPTLWNANGLMAVFSVMNAHIKEHKDRNNDGNDDS